MIFHDEKELKERVVELTGRKIYGQPVVMEDTTEYMNICGGTILRLGGNDYFVTGDATEGRFGIDEQPKFWVKYAVDLQSGEKKIIKLVFYEHGTSRLGPFLYRWARSLNKEASILTLVKEHPHFMHGHSLSDRAGNLVRVIDFVRGPNLYRYLNDLAVDHETYFFNILPGIMEKLLQAFVAIDFLNQEGHHHGDVRTDHIIMQKDSEEYVWIDFDVEVSHSDFDLWTLGSLLVHVVGKGEHTPHEVKRNPHNYPKRMENLSFSPDDVLFLLNNRITNLRQLFPYIPEKLNRILRSFSSGTNHFYENIKSLIDDVGEVFF